MSEFKYPEIGVEASRWELWKEKRRQRKYCFHHDMGGNPSNTRPARSFIHQRIINMGRRKMFWCEESVGGCGRTWIV